MKKLSKKVLSGAIMLGLALPVSALADQDQALQQKVDALAKEVQSLKRDAGMTKRKSLGQWLKISGD